MLEFFMPQMENVHYPHKDLSCTLSLVMSLSRVAG